MTCRDPLHCTRPDPWLDAHHDDILMMLELRYYCANKRMSRWYARLRPTGIRINVTCHAAHSMTIVIRYIGQYGLWTRMPRANRRFHYSVKRTRVETNVICSDNLCKLNYELYIVRELCNINCTDLLSIKRNLNFGLILDCFADLTISNSPANQNIV